MSAAGREATQDYSRGISPPPAARAGLSALRVLLLLSGLLGGLLLVAADLSTLYEVDVLTVAKASVSGHAQHSYALVLVGLVALPMCLGAARGRRPAMLALGVLGLLALGVAAIAGDFHDVHSSGVLGTLYESAAASPKRGFYFETLGGVLLTLGGFALLLLGRAGRVRPTAPSSRRVTTGAEESADPPPRAQAGSDGAG